MITPVVLALRHLMMLDGLEIRLVLLVLRDMRCMLWHFKADLVRQPLDNLGRPRLLLKRLLSLGALMIEIYAWLPHRCLDRLSLFGKLPRLVVCLLGFSVIVHLLLVACRLLEEPVARLAEGLLKGRVLV